LEPIDLGHVSRALSLDPSGVWLAPAPGSVRLRFPEDGHQACFDLEDGSFWFQHRNACITAAVEALGRPLPGALLDIGGGNGAVSAALEARGVAAVVLEPGPDGARNARSRGLANVVCATLEQCAFAPGSFGACGLFDVIEHVGDDVGLLRGARQVVRPDGALFVTVPAYQWLWSSEDEHAGHVRRYTLGQLQAALAAAAFEVTYATYFFAALTLPVLVARSLRHRLGRRDARAVNAGAARQHAPNAAARAAVDLLLRPEVDAVRARRRIPFGTSCLAVARPV